MSKPYNPIICVEFDGVIHPCKSQWLGVSIIPDDPMPGAIEWLMSHLPSPFERTPTCEHKGPIIQIYSFRSKSMLGLKAMADWLVKHGLPKAYIDRDILKFPTKKPAAFMPIDERAFSRSCFGGTFPSTEEMMAFTPWGDGPEADISPFVYFVSYAYGNHIGNIEMKNDHPITSITDIRYIEARLKRELGVIEPVCVTGWQSLDKFVGEKR